MKSIKVIIGSNFGDEGKGLMTDYMCSINENSVVIRFNSSAQAGHTVVTPDSKRHVFGHFGAGSLQGIPTFLSSYFSVNPLLFLKEYDELNKIGNIPHTMIDPNCPVVIPQDMLLNQILERHRGDNKHGSCGLGYNESIVRNSMDRYRITCGDIFSGIYKDKLELIRKEYIDKRLEQLNLKSSNDNLINVLFNANIIEHFIYDVDNNFKSKIELSNIESVLENYQTPIFEGAQGLMLSEDCKYFPYVTHSKTGVSNVIDLLEEAKPCELNIEVIYVTRSYLTRHGAGPLPNEMKEKPYKNITDLTNIQNEFQGVLRFAPLDIDLLSENIENDYNKIHFKSKNKKINVSKSIAITCLDQIDNNKAEYYKDKSLLLKSTDKFIEDILRKINPDNCYLSYGVSRDNIVKY
ncbi:adenylosuccinate synthetase [Clostridium beijerinckii]|uniref:Adenylosuccinate synthetase n=2 Tax=Clostridium beijerinckii TaxID=1520 RepID=A0A9Q5CU83_CLOBE|nr:adenylosuccinate synthetase [Clostridium beijerinckii]AQS04818.1 adenylosuccinate synthetase [Clostridium beijerinckii]MBA2887505.1 adenylosuccinate synthase [Clostridium beijerinckii]MBA2902395.1 adenylosuccinate synthase [Clostridium beijerinckii]MBA2912315.1 adenylosuccinate synthase [Clostridium beijerinckii]MBA9015622.1 adenylosuccinate synthase [Clostridium beijerinckii]